MEPAAVDRSAERAALNEATFREANERIAMRRDELGLDHETTPFICECEEEACQELVKLSPREFEAVRERENQYFVVTGHLTRGDVVQEFDGWAIVEKGE